MSNVPPALEQLSQETPIGALMDSAKRESRKKYHSGCGLKQLPGISLAFPGRKKHCMGIRSFSLSKSVMAPIP